MKNKKVILYFKILCLFGFAMFFSIAGEYLTIFFGDWTCIGSGDLIKGLNYNYHFENCNYNGYHKPTLHWGYRHYLFTLMGITFFIMQITNIISHIDDKNN